MLEYRLTQDSSCSYLSDKGCLESFKIVKDCSALYCQQLMERGWRRFGETFFRPICHDCEKCESLRIDAFEFQLSSSMRRVCRKNESIERRLQRPSVSEEKIELYNRFHAYRSNTRGWKYTQITAEPYHDMFVSGDGDFGFEVCYYDGKKLIAVDMIDILPIGISSVYFYYDPDYQHLSLGVYSLLVQIEMAKKYGLPHIYVGYAVRENASLNYKFRYHPYDVLQNRATLEEKAVWLPEDA
jgi:leucyl-tRNA---protein transferase